MKYGYLFRLQSDGEDETLIRDEADLLPGTDPETIVATIVRKHCDLLCPVMQEAFPCKTSLHTEEEYGIVSGYVHVEFPDGATSTAYVSTQEA